MTTLYPILLILVGPVVFKKISSFRSKSTSGKPSAKLTLSPTLTSPTSIVLYSLISLHFLYQLYSLISQFFYPNSIFLNRSLNLSINQSTSSIRSTLLTLDSNSIPQSSNYPLNSLGLSSPHDTLTALSTLLDRLSRFEGRILYLLVGSDPILSCIYCVRKDDYLLYSLFNDVLPEYIKQLIFIGLLSLRFKSVDNLDHFIKMLLRRSKSNGAGTGAAESRTFKDSSNWRAFGTWSLVIGFGFEVIVLMFFAHVSTDKSWLNHYHHNLSLLRTLHFLILPTLVLLFPTQRIPPSYQRSVLRLDSVEKVLGETVLSGRCGRVSREGRLGEKGEKGITKSVKAKVEVVEGENEGGVGGSSEKIEGLDQKEKREQIASTDKVTSTSASISIQNINETLSIETTTTPTTDPSSTTSLPTQNSSQLSIKELLIFAIQAGVKPHDLERLKKQCEDASRGVWEEVGAGREVTK